MIDPFYGTLLSSGLSLAGGLFGRRGPSGMDKNLKGYEVHRAQREEARYSEELNEWRLANLRAAESHEMNKTAFSERGSEIRRTVADAKAAGLHPLFALGGAVGSTPTFAVDGGDPMGGNGYYSGGQFETGSAAGDVFQAAAEAVGGLIFDREEQRADTLATARARRDNAEADYYASLAKRASQTATVTSALPDAAPLNWKKVPVVEKQSNPVSHPGSYRIGRVGPFEDWRVGRGAKGNDAEHAYQDASLFMGIVKMLEDFGWNVHDQFVMKEVYK